MLENNTDKQDKTICREIWPIEDDGENKKNTMEIWPVKVERYGADYADGMRA